MKPKILKLLPLFLLSLFAVQGQNNDPHGKHESAITGMPSEKILMVLDITVHDSLQYQLYRMKVEPLIEKFGGIYLVRSGGMAFDSDSGRKVIPVEGNWNPNRFIIVQWESLEQLQNFTTSEEYKTVAKFRENSASIKSIIVREYH